MMKILSQISEERKYIGYLNDKTGKSHLGVNNLVKETESSSLESLDLNL